jgi:uncharacterized membrane protein YozB (DUF420 family)
VGIAAIPATIGYIGLIIYHKDLAMIIGAPIAIWAIIYNAKEKYFEHKQNKALNLAKDLDKKIMRWTLKKRT